jgi:lipoprotein-anchoring transpeptidase ErfK/SrfK
MARVMSFGIPLALAAFTADAAARPQDVASAAATASGRSDGMRLTVSLSQRRLLVQDGEQTVREFGVAIGSRAHPTPTGNFSIRRLVWNPGWVPPKAKWAKGKQPEEPGSARNPMQAVKIYFKEPDYYIHGTNDQQSIGTAASHGCLRMTPEDAAELGAYVMEHGGQPREESWFRRVFRFGRSTVIYLNNPVPLTITS